MRNCVVNPTKTLLFANDEITIKIIKAAQFYRIVHLLQREVNRSHHVDILFELIPHLTVEQNVELQRYIDHLVTTDASGAGSAGASATAVVAAAATPT